MMKTYPVFRKTFHIPSEWLKSDDITYLVNHSYGTVQAQQAFVEISTRLRRLGYMEDNNRMIHDYLHFLLKDLFDFNGETYITECDIRGSPRIAGGLLNGTTPDFVLKKNKGRSKTLIVDIYVGDKPTSEIKSKYRALGFFADLIIITPHDLCSQLRGVLPAEDIDYLYKNYQVFLIEYYYWKACMKLQKILFNDVQNVAQRELAVKEPVDPLQREKYLLALEEYAAKVCSQDDL